MAILPVSERVAHIPSPGLVPLCGWQRGFTVTDHDPSRVTCPQCWAVAGARATLDEPCQ